MGVVTCVNLSCDILFLYHIRSLNTASRLLFLTILKPLIIVRNNNRINYSIHSNLFHVLSGRAADVVLYVNQSVFKFSTQMFI